MKKIIKLFLIVAITLQFVSCDNNENDISKFEQTPTERLNARKKELADLLTSSEFGWKAIYFTDSTQLGGFTHLFQFNDAINVAMASDFDADTSIFNSQYEIQLGSTVSLVFTTKNRIHLLSDSDNYPTGELRGKGYKGDFQFLYYGQENGEIIFKTNRSFEELRFVKATAQDWTDLAKHITMNTNLNEIPRTLFKTLEINNGSGIKSFDFEVEVASRFAFAIAADEILPIAIAYTPTGITIKPAITVNNQKLSVFTYDDATGNFVATGINNVSATIKISLPNDDYKDLLPGNPENAFAFISDYLKGAKTNSIQFLELLNQVNINLPSNNAIDRVQFVFNENSINYVMYTFAGDKNSIIHYFTTTEDSVNKTIIFTPQSWEENEVAISAPEFLKNLDNQIMNPSGFYIKKEVFKIYAPNDIYTFTSVTLPAFGITTYAFQ